MTHYSHKSIPDANVDADGSSSFGYMMSQNFPLKKEMSHQIRLFTPGNGFNLKTHFYVQNHCSQPKIDPQVNFSNFQAEENFFIFNI